MPYGCQSGRRSNKLDKEKAIANFVERVESLCRLPLVTNLEMRELYGEEVAAALEELERFNQAEKICQQCDGDCCHKFSCEFYAPQFSQCPIHDLRPAICRFHFCEKFQGAGSLTIKELSEIFLSSLSFAAASGSRRVGFFDLPPFAEVSHELVEAISPWVNAVRLGRLNPGYGQRRIRQEAMKYRTTGVPLSP